MSSEHGQRGELERTLGLPAALAIGLGTMVGAGIFVFPGLAGGRAGPGAIISFAIGASIALLVAFSASELATAMPASGGAYHHVSRALGGLPGTLVGIGQWTGLVFAAAFYLVGFGHYAAQLLGRAGDGGFQGLVPVVGLVAAVVLIGINVLGTRHAGALQNAVVAVLLVLLGVVLVRGGWLLTMPGEPVTLPERWFPGGPSSVFRTAALVFTAYLGFVQIATVGGEVRAPNRTLPRAMLGSVVIVGVIYCLTMLVATATLSPDRLAALGETAMIDVARELLGGTGATAVLAAGLLATLSSANASILSSSRTVFALSRDGHLPGAAARISERFGTPHIALLAAGVPIAALAAVGRVELLAEVASVLHLVIYGLICIAQIHMRGRAVEAYQPAFRVPGHPVVPVLGAACSFGLVLFMSRAAMGISAAILVFAAAWHWMRDRDGGNER